MSQAYTRKDLARFTTALRETLRQAVSTRDEIQAESLDLSGGGLDLAGDEGADREFEEVDLDALDVENETAHAAAAALARIADGTFGRCVDCGEWIARSRLEAVPQAPRCLGCQETLETADA